MKKIVRNFRKNKKDNLNGPNIEFTKGTNQNLMIFGGQQTEFEIPVDYPN